jgi:predicted ATP-binding protein involved in virulence
MSSSSWNCPKRSDSILANSSNGWDVAATRCDGSTALRWHDGIGLRFENYKSFGPGFVGFDSLASTNVIIGRNNSGKSALLDVVEFACNHAKGIPNFLYHASNPSRVAFSTQLPENVVKAVFQPNASHGPFSGNHWQVGRQLVGARIDILCMGTIGRLLSLERNLDHTTRHSLNEYYERLAQSVENPFKNKLFQRLSAERDIIPETLSGDLEIKRNGQGFTSVVARFLTKFEHPTDLVAVKMLEALNTIFAPDASFTSISVQQYGDGPWEIFLNERGKGTIPLAHSGSGLKTILLVVGFFVLLPHLKGKALSNFIFAFEELENNLHPALQRRLLQYITDLARKHETLVLITTHSNVVIDLYSRDREAQILHVTHLGGKSQVRRVQTYVDNCGVLDDLDVRASDLLQANGVVWVEGPSDRLYFNRWIELATDGELSEGTHYQCVFYGGRLLAHLSASDPTVDADEVVQIFRVNRNAMLMIDSDKKAAGTPLNSTKQRLVSEIESLGGLAWVTSGREIEHYLPINAIQSRFPDAHDPPTQFRDFSEYLDELQPGEGKRFERNKVLFAETMTPALTKESINATLDLSNRLQATIALIRKWNGL